MKKYVVLIVLVFCSLTGCQNKEAESALNEQRERAELEAKNKDLAIKYMEAISNGDFDSLRELLSDDYAMYSPSGYPDPTSKDNFIAGIKEAGKSFPEFNWNIEDIIAAKDKVICRIIITAKYKGDIPGVPTGEKEIKFSLISIMRMENGKIAEEWQEDDQLGFARQIGMVLAPAESVN